MYVILIFFWMNVIVFCIVFVWVFLCFNCILSILFYIIIEINIVKKMLRCVSYMFVVRCWFILLRFRVGNMYGNLMRVGEE